MSIKYSVFIKRFPENTIFVKLLNNELNHYGFQYNIGLNVDTIPFNPTGLCLSGGLYFTTIEYIEKYIKYGVNLAHIKLCDDAVFYCDPTGYKWKTNKFIITKIEQTQKICELAIKNNALALRYIKEQTEELCKLAVQKIGPALEYVKEQTEEICKLAIKNNVLALKFVKEQTEEICKFAIENNVLALKFVKEQTEEICKFAVKKNGKALEYVKQQTEEICKLAVSQDYHALKFVKEKTEEICELAVQQYCGAHNISHK
jgi:hypothetical protein